MRWMHRHILPTSTSHLISPAGISRSVTLPGSSPPSRAVWFCLSVGFPQWEMGGNAILSIPFLSALGRCFQLCSGLRAVPGNNARGLFELLFGGNRGAVLPEAGTGRMLAYERPLFPVSLVLACFLSSGACVCLVSCRGGARLIVKRAGAGAFWGMASWRCTRDLRMQS
jgi:hypothetical protein